MALTTKQTRFVEHRMRGATHRDAAVQAGYKAASASEAGARLARHPKVVAELARLRGEARQQAGAVPRSVAPAVPVADPQVYLMQVVNDVGLDQRLRVDAAKALMPFAHPRVAPAGKLQAAQDAAARPSRFGKTPQPPAKLLAFVPRKPECKK